MSNGGDQSLRQGQLRQGTAEAETVLSTRRPTPLSGILLNVEAVDLGAFGVCAAQLGPSLVLSAVVAGFARQERPGDVPSTPGPK